MSSLMIQGGNPMARLGQGFGFLTGMVVDQHFYNRNRLNRLLDVLARNPSYFGLGIDEQTAVVVKGHTLTVLGDAQVRLCVPTSPRQQSRVQVLKAGEQVDLESLNPPMVASGRSTVAKEKQHMDHGAPAP